MTGIACRTCFRVGRPRLIPRAVRPLRRFPHVCIATLLAHEVPDQRLGSCTAHFSDYLEDTAPEGSNTQILSALENRLAATNLELFVALPQLQLADLDSARGLPLAAEQLARGVQFWAKVSGPENVPALVGLVAEVEVTGS